MRRLLKNIFSKKVIMSDKSTFKHMNPKNIDGKSIVTSVVFDFPNGDDMEIACYDYSKIHGSQDHLNFKISTKDIEEFEFIYLRKSLLKLPNVSIYAQNLSVKDIIKLIETNYVENYPQKNFRSKIFFHIASILI